MPAIHVRNVPESLLAALRERATRHGRSMQQDILEILKAAAAEQEVDAKPPIRLITTRTSGKTRWRREDLYGDEGR